MHTQGVASAYDRLAPAYDFLFGPVFRQGRSAAVKAANGIGGTILEVGVGTGLSLTQYGQNCSVTGIDISAAMLEKARQRVADGKLSHVTRLELMNAEQLAFPESSFDAVVAQYVISAVPNPERALSELARVVRPGGEIIITSRISAENGVRGTLEHWLMPVTSRLGWRTEFPWRRFADWMASMPDITLLEHRKLPPLGHFSLIRYGRRANAVAKASLRKSA
jgi:phosphatidylethanolamine/phosphatidyl-N-methylethanolamine N-methyltransferase